NDDLVLVPRLSHSKRTPVKQRGSSGLTLRKRNRPSSEREASGVFGEDYYNTDDNDRSRRTTGMGSYQQLPAKRMTLGPNSSSRFAGVSLSTALTTPAAALPYGSGRRERHHYPMTTLPRYTSMLSSTTPSQERALATSRNIMANLDRMAATAATGAATQQGQQAMQQQQLYRPPRPLRRRRPPLSGLRPTTETHTGMKSLSALLATKQPVVDTAPPTSSSPAAAALPSASKAALPAGMQSPVFGSSTNNNKPSSNSPLFGLPAEDKSTSTAATKKTDSGVFKTTAAPQPTEDNKASTTPAAAAADTTTTGSIFGNATTPSSSSALFGGSTATSSGAAVSSIFGAPSQPPASSSSSADAATGPLEKTTASSLIPSTGTSSFSSSTPATTGPAAGASLFAGVASS
ncbi:hypothetical protein FOZ62_008490, partial [Perkinsus olseni]